jgi:hypothetical protein
MVDEDLAEFWNELRPDSKGAKDAIAEKVASRARGDREKVLHAIERRKIQVLTAPTPKAKEPENVPRQGESSPVLGWRNDIRKMKRRQMGWDG